jgi:hypothetical protein
MFQLFPAIIVLGITYGIYKLFELYVRRKERIMMIEKLSISESAVIPPDVSKYFSSPTPTSWALRLGLLLTGLGLGLSTAVIMNHFMDMERYSRDELLYFAFMLLFGGLGLVIAYLIEQKQKKD